MMYDVAVLGGGISGMATAARLQAAGLTTIVVESHGQLGGCAGFFRRKGFAFDVGATTLVDFSAGGVGGELLAAIGIDDLALDELPGYLAWLPDRCVTLFRDVVRWRGERLRMLGDSPAHLRLWKTLDHLADVFWNATRRGVKLPAQSTRDIWRIATMISPADWPLARYIRWTVGDLLRSLQLRGDKPLCGLLSMLLEDTVHADIDDAPLINGSLGITIRGAGLARARGGMCGFWGRFAARYRELGGVLRMGSPVASVSREQGYLVHLRRGFVRARQVVSALPIELTTRLAPKEIGESLQPYLRRNKAAVGGALVLFLGVPQGEVAGQDFTHHQLLQDYGLPLGNGNNMFISVSSPGDTLSAPAGFRAVMISTHCKLEEWEGLSEQNYSAQKVAMTELLLRYSRRVYPRLGESAIICELATPRTFERFTRRPRGAVGGFRQQLSNTNQRAVPHTTGLPGFWLVGDTTWPGLGTVACVHGSRIVAEGILARTPKPIRKIQHFQELEHEPDDVVREPATRY
ncbi:MAG: phytoene desaturase family protein [Pirellulaceae bacterium]